MKLEKLNRWLSFSGNLAILLGLIALAVEINDNTAAVRSQELGALQEQTQASLAAIMGEDIRRIYVKSLFEPTELTLEELQGMTAYVANRLTNLERMHQAYANGIIRQADWGSELIGVPIYLGSPFGRTVWENMKGDWAHKPEFVDAVDTALATSPIPPDDKFLLDLQNDLQSLRPSPSTTNR